MSRSNNKSVDEGPVRTGSNLEDESLDNVSVHSHTSEAASPEATSPEATSPEAASPAAASSEAAKKLANERFEKKFEKALEQVTEKSAEVRVQALQTICEQLIHRYMPDFVEDRKRTLVDIVEKSVCRGKGQELAWAARLAPLLMLQLGGEQVMSKGMHRFLLSTVQDKSVSFDARAKCCTALGLINFLNDPDIDELVQLMQVLESIFAGSYLRGDGKTPISVTAEAGTLHAEALSSWGLLLTLIASDDFVSLMSTGQHKFPTIKRFLGLLESPHLAVRIAAGKTIALILESGRGHDDHFLEEHISELCDAVKQLATDSAKYRTKNDRKTQRAAFRDVLRYLEENISPEINVRFGDQVLTLDSWERHHQYSAFSSILGPSMTSQLQENEFIRDFFELGPRPPSDIYSLFLFQRNRHIRVFGNKANFKARSKATRNNRNKRCANTLDQDLDLDY